jgi:hypothetical protein
MAAKPDPQADDRARYEIRAGDGGLFAVWDMVRGRPVVDAEGLAESIALELARRLNDAYRRSSGGR